MVSKRSVVKHFAGKKRTFSFSMLTWEHVTEELKVPMTDVIDMLQGYQNLKVMRVLLFSALKAHSDLSGEHLDVNSFQVGEAMGDDPAVLGEIMSFMASTLAAGNPSPMPGGQEGKKPHLPKSGGMPLQK